MYRLFLRAIAPATLATLAFTSHASAHCFVGSRFFPATLNTDDPCVADELSLPTVSRFKTGDIPSATQTDISVDFAKRITENFGVSISTTWTHVAQRGNPSASGFQNLETAFQYQLLKDSSRELAMLAGVSVEWGGTGAAGVGAERFSVITPTFNVGKGFGDLPDTVRWAKPFAITGQIGYAIPTRSSTTDVDPDTGEITVANNPNFLVYSGSLQYSLPYLKSNVTDLGLPDFINHLIPIVEAQFQTPVSNNFGTGIGTTGTINPGVIWAGQHFQVGLEAVVPVNRDSGRGVGVIGQLHLYLDDLFPKTLGQPLIGAASNPSKISFGK
ncbi:MAG TPA: hypothetical protein VHN11_11750 [Xanthobacteraceae bacterium]|jgi:hypothetical protein|nr:hypothetical protein [Xanthobacteraceae bacterium]